MYMQVSEQCSNLGKGMAYASYIYIRLPTVSKWGIGLARLEITVVERRREIM